MTPTASPHEINGWWFTARPCTRTAGWLSWCAKTPRLGSGPMDVDPSQDVHFEFAATAGEALRKLKAEVLN